MSKELKAWFTVDELNAWADKKLKENPQWAEQPTQQQEPVAWHVYFGNEDEPNYVCIGEKPVDAKAVIRPLVFGDTTPPQRKPLTDEMRTKMKEQCDSMEMRGAFADGWMSAEAAHGIKGEHMNKIDYNKLTISGAEAEKYSFVRPPSDIIFYNNLGNKQVEVLRISKDGITANPDVPVDEAADAVIRVLDAHIKRLVNRTWVGLTQEDMPSGEDPMFDHKYFIAGMVYATKVLKEKNT